MSIKAALKDPHGVLAKWDSDAADPCSWTMVTCSPDYLVIGLYVLAYACFQFHEIHHA